MLNVLFLCTGNSARSILAEALLNHLDPLRFTAFSAGSFPTGRVHPVVLETLAEHGLPATGYRSKSWDEFAGPNAPMMDIVITVCDQAAGEACPVWPGRPLTAHWGIPDPAAVDGTPDDRRRAFHSAFQALKTRIDALLRLPLDSRDRASLQRQLESIGETLNR